MQVNFYATLRLITGSKAVQFQLQDGGTVRDLVNEIVRVYPALRQELLDNDGQLYGHVHVFVNGRDNRFLENMMDTPIHNEDNIDIFPAVGGGLGMTGGELKISEVRLG